MSFCPSNPNRKQLTLRLARYSQVAPAHGPCGPNKPGQTLELVPHIAWSNGIPDADLSADFTLGGEKFAFKGYGYQDKVRRQALSRNLFLLAHAGKIPHKLQGSVTLGLMAHYVIELGR